MQCRSDWTLSLHTLLPSTFLDGVYRKHRAIILLEREKALLPSSQERARAMAFLPKVEATLRHIRNQKDKLQRRNRRYLELQSRLKQPGGILRPEDAHLDDSSDEETIAFSRQREALSSKPGTPQEDLITPKTTTFIRACPRANCRGFVTDRWECGLCLQQVCRHCHEMVFAAPTNHTGNPHAQIMTTIEETATTAASSVNTIIAVADHVCHPDQVASAQLIAAETKPCPTCMAPIRKAEGCQHMFCWSCKSGFNWKTRRPISLDRLHNPHFFQWQRILHATSNTEEGNETTTVAATVTNNNNNDCLPDETEHERFDRFMRMNVDLNLLRFLFRGDETYCVMMAKRVQYLHQLLVLYRWDFRNAMDPQDPLTYEDLRADHLNGHLDEETWKHKIISRERLQCKLQAIKALVALWFEVGFEQLARVQQVIHEWATLRRVEGRVVYEHVLTFFHTMSSLELHCNAQLEYVSIQYHCRVPFFDVDTLVLTMRRHRPTTALIPTGLQIQQRRRRKHTDALKMCTVVDPVSTMGDNNDSDDDINEVKATSSQNSMALHSRTTLHPSSTLPDNSALSDERYSLNRKAVTISLSDSETNGEDSSSEPQDMDEDEELDPYPDYHYVPFVHDSDDDDDDGDNVVLDEISSEEDIEEVSPSVVSVLAKKTTTLPIDAAVREEKRLTSAAATHLQKRARTSESTLPIIAAVTPLKKPRRRSKPVCMQ